MIYLKKKTCTKSNNLFERHILKYFCQCSQHIAIHQASDKALVHFTRSFPIFQRQGNCLPQNFFLVVFFLIFLSLSSCSLLSSFSLPRCHFSRPLSFYFNSFLPPSSPFTPFPFGSIFMTFFLSSFSSTQTSTKIKLKLK